MSPKEKEYIQKSVSKVVVKKDVSPKKVSSKTKTDSKKVQVTKNTGKNLKHKGIQTESAAEEKITADDLTSKGSLHFYYYVSIMHNNFDKNLNFQQAQKKVTGKS